MSVKIVIDRKAVSDALYELEHLIIESLSQGSLQRVNAERRAVALRKAYTESTEITE